MTIISIDFSILYPGICICKDFESFKWLAIVNTKLSKKDKENIDSALVNYPNLKIAYTQTKRSTQPEYHLTERVKLTNYLELIELLIQNLKDLILPGEEVICALEGISFGSSGNALVDISQATGMLKQKIVDEILNGEASRFFVFSPSELKNAIGCKGNANKLDIFNKFSTDPILNSVKSSDLFKLVNTEKWIVKDDRVASPFMDMIDSYLGVVKIHQLSK
jgi:Holliday junction resolvasome RuvABC endonuclease subunit